MTPFVKVDIKADEGCEHEAYPDPASPLGQACARAGLHGRDWRKLANHAGLSGDPWTIGRGHCGTDVHPGLVWTDEQIEAAFEADFAHAVASLDAKLSWWRSLSDARQDVLANMTFNMGIGRPPLGKEPGHGLLGFPNTLAAIKRGAYATAAANLRVSKWERQTHGRADRLANQLERGVR